VPATTERLDPETNRAAEVLRTDFGVGRTLFNLAVVPRLERGLARDIRDLWHGVGASQMRLLALKSGGRGADAAADIKETVRRNAPLRGSARNAEQLKAKNARVALGILRLCGDTPKEEWNQRERQLCRGAALFLYLEGDASELNLAAPKLVKARDPANPGKFNWELSNTGEARADLAEKFDVGNALFDQTVLRMLIARCEAEEAREGWKQMEAAIDAPHSADSHVARVLKASARRPRGPDESSDEPAWMTGSAQRHSEEPPRTSVGRVRTAGVPRARPGDAQRRARTRRAQHTRPPPTSVSRHPAPLSLDSIRLVRGALDDPSIGSPDIGESVPEFTQNGSFDARQAVRHIRDKVRASLDLAVDNAALARAMNSALREKCRSTEGALDSSRQSPEQRGGAGARDPGVVKWLNPETRAAWVEYCASKFRREAANLADITRHLRYELGGSPTQATPEVLPRGAQESWEYLANGIGELRLKARQDGASMWAFDQALHRTCAGALREKSWASEANRRAWATFCSHMDADTCEQLWPPQKAASAASALEQGPPAAARAGEGQAPGSGAQAGAAAARAGEGQAPGSGAQAGAAAAGQEVPTLKRGRGAWRQYCKHMAPVFRSQKTLAGLEKHLAPLEARAAARPDSEALKQDLKTLNERIETRRRALRQSMRTPKPPRPRSPPELAGDTERLLDFPRCGPAKGRSGKAPRTLDALGPRPAE
jgi:hypothetical protein